MTALPRAMLLAAGLGTRLAPLTNELPKPLVWLGDRPLIDAIVSALAGAGFDRVVANTHHLPHCFDEAWRASQPLEVALIHEPHILGTGGGVANARSLLGEGDVLVWNADIAAELDVGRLLAAAANHPSRSVLVTGPSLPARAGTLGLDDQGRVVRVRALDRGGETRSADYAGIALLRASLRASLPAEGCLVGDLLVPALAAGEIVETFALERPFFDLGTPRHYVEANLDWLARKTLTSFVHPTAHVAASVSLDRAVVARDARVEGEGTLSRAVVWPGASARAPLDGAVVTPKTLVVL